MLLVRTISIVLFGPLLLVGGCVTPDYNYGPAGHRKGSDDVETLIRVDRDGNVYRGDPKAAKAADDRQPDSQPKPAGRDADGQSAQQSGAGAADKSEYAVLEAALHEKGVDAQRLEELIAAYGRPSHAESEPSSTKGKPSTSPPGGVKAAARRVAHRSTITQVPPGVVPTVVHSTRFDLEYDDEVLGPGGIAKVELYGTRDGGRTWARLGEDRDRRSPYTVEMPAEGIYGFRIAVAGHNGLASRPPQPGEPPELWVRVDFNQPMFRGSLRAAGEPPSDRPGGDESSISVHIADDDSHMPAPGEEARPSPSDRDEPNAGAVVPASHSEPLAADSWRTHLTRAIESLQRQLNEDSGSAETPEHQLKKSLQRVLGHNDEAGEHEARVATASLTEEEKARLDAHLRLMYLTAGRHEEAIRSSRFQSAQENEFWAHQLHGMKMLLEAHDGTPPQRRASAALVELRDATDTLARLSELHINNLTFCTAAQSFGIYETTIEGGRWKHKNYAERRFEPEQPVVLYFEIANFASEQHTSREFPDGAWRTSLAGSYTIVDSAGRPVQQRELKLRDDLCRNRRRDYFIAYKTWIPKLNPGFYTLELLVEDTLANKIGTSSIDFEVVSR